MSDNLPIPPSSGSPPTIAELKALLEENLKLTHEMHDNVRKIRRHFVWQRAISFIYLLLIVGPVILAAIYLPPIIGPMLRQYQQLFESLQLMETTNGQTGASAGGGAVTLPPGVMDLLEKFGRESGGGRLPLPK